MPEGYLHLTCEQRCQIYALLQSGHSQAHIARQIGVDPSTISRELVRNTGARGYRFKQAHEKASQRREEASDKPRKMTPDLVELIEEKLTQEQWSPDQISGRLAKDGVAFISHERIYQHVWKDKKDGGTLYLHLRHSGKKYNRRKGKNSGRGLISQPRRIFDPLRRDRAREPARDIVYQPWQKFLSIESRRCREPWRRTGPSGRQVGRCGATDRTVHDIPFASRPTSFRRRR